MRILIDVSMNGTKKEMPALGKGDKKKYNKLCKCKQF